MNTATKLIINVADDPSDHAWTYGQITKDAQKVADVGPFIDTQTPEGCFGITVKNIGGNQTYWFRGALGDPAAQVVARTQYINGRPHHYVGGSAFGGTLTTMFVEEG